MTPDTHGPAGATGTTAASVGYQGDYTDPGSGNVWMGARWYQPTTGGFTSRDTVFGMLKTPVSLNRYTYAGGDPLQYFDPDGHAPWDVVTKAVNTVTKTVGKAASAVNRHVVQPVLRSAAVLVVKSTTATLTRTVGGATRRSVRFVQRHAKTIVRTGVVTVAAGATYLGCSAATGGAGAVTGCSAAAGAVGGLVNGAFDCPGHSAAECARGMAIQGAAGAAAGAAFGIVGGAGLGSALTRNLTGGLASGITHSVTDQALSTGRINVMSALKEGGIGLVTAGALHGAGTAARGVRGARASTGSAPTRRALPGGGDDTVSLYRAVSQAEADDIAAHGFRPRPDGRSYSDKLFATSAEDATRYGRYNYGLDRQPFQVTQVQVPKSFADSLYRFRADGMTAVSVDMERLAELNRVGSTSMLDALPWWAK